MSAFVHEEESVILHQQHFYANTLPFVHERVCA
jgi:hypothetical protein